MSTQNIFDMVDTWNASGTTFVAIRMNVTDTASAADSLLMDLQVGGVSRFSVTKAGVISAGTLALGSLTGLGTGVGTFLATPSSANLAAAVTDETGTGALVFANTPTLTTPNIGAATGTSVNLSSRSFINTLTIGLGGQTAVATNTALGFETLNSASLTGVQNTGVGYRALLSNTTGNFSSAVGQGALQFNTTGSNNSAVGQAALQFNTTGNNNSAVGVFALNGNTTGGSNSAMGVNALRDNTTGGSNSAVGLAALLNNTTGVSNNAMGAGALLSNTTGGSNSALGNAALQNNTTGGSNSAVGLSALRCNTTGSSNSALGLSALRRIAGSNNLAAGFEAGIAISRGVATLGAIVGGSGYTDGTYNGVNLIRSSGSTFDASPTANITVSGGAVTAVTLVTAGSGFQDTDTVLTATAASIGGTGTGFTVEVATLTGAVSDNNTLVGYRAAHTQTEGSGNIAIGASVALDSLTGSNQINIGGRYFHNRMRLVETTDPAAPAADNAIIFVRDNGSGKTQLCVRFPTGAVQVISTEP
jgi:hypothetical protein